MALIQPVIKDNVVELTAPNMPKLTVSPYRYIKTYLNVSSAPSCGHQSRHQDKSHRVECSIRLL